MKTLFLVLLLYFVAWSCTEEPTDIPPSIPNVTASVTGAVQVDYSGSGRVTTTIFNNWYTLQLSTSGVISNTRYSMGIFIFYSGGQEQEGTFPFIENPTTIGEDHAWATFEIGEGSGRKIFKSLSGSVKIDTIIGASITGSFSFVAREQTTGDTVVVSDGRINF